MSAGNYDKNQPVNSDSDLSPFIPGWRRGGGTEIYFIKIRDFGSRKGYHFQGTSRPPLFKS